MKRGQDLKSRAQSGQSTIEFALTLLLIVVFFMGFTQISVTFGFGNFAHYATFMAARAQLSAADSSDRQIVAAQTVLAKMLKTTDSLGAPDRWPSIAQGEGGGGELKGAAFGEGNEYTPGDKTKSWMQGVRYTFRSRLVMVPFGGGASSNSVSLTSESWLGREPNYPECSRELISNDASFDNGC